MESENQFIIRFPQDMAQQLNNYFDSKTQIQPKLTIYPYLQKDDQGQKTVFNISLNGQSKKATLIQLPTIIETFKTVDKVNYFKSNDINEMVYVHQNNQYDVPFQIAKKVSQTRKFDNRKICKYKCHSGVTQPTKYIRQRYFRKKPRIEHNEMKLVQSQLNVIRQQITAAPRGEQIQEEKKAKRKYNKKFQ